MGLTRGLFVVRKALVRFVAQYFDININLMIKVQEK